jgi:hypothetical protein
VNGLDSILGYGFGGYIQKGGGTPFQLTRQEWRLLPAPRAAPTPATTWHCFLRIWHRVLFVCHAMLPHYWADGNSLAPTIHSENDI